MSRSQDDSGNSGTSSSLLELLRRKPSDETAWQEFVHRYRPKVLAWCQGRGLQNADAEDVTQLVLAKLSSHMRHFEYDPQKGRFRSWLRKVTRNTWNDFVTEKCRSDVSGGSRIQEMIHSAKAKKEFSQELEAAFDLELLDIAMDRVQSRVASQTWQAFRLTAIERLSGAEAGRQLGMPVGHVFVARQRVQKMLAREIEQLEAGEP